MQMYSAFFLVGTTTKPSFPHPPDSFSRVPGIIIYMVCTWVGPKKISHEKIGREIWRQENPIGEQM